MVPNAVDNSLHTHSSRIAIPGPVLTERFARGTRVASTAHPTSVSLDDQARWAHVDMIFRNREAALQAAKNFKTTAQGQRQALQSTMARVRSVLDKVTESPNMYHGPIAQATPAQAKELAEVDQKMLTTLDDLSTIISTSTPYADLPGVVTNKYPSVSEKPLKSFAEDVAQETLVDSRVNIICEQLLSAEATLKLKNQEISELCSETKCLHEMVGSQQLLGAHNNPPAVLLESQAQTRFLSQQLVAQLQQNADLQAENVALKKVGASNDLLLAQSSHWSKVTLMAEVEALRRSFIDQQQSFADSNAEKDCEIRTLKELATTQQFLMAQPSSLAFQASGRQFAATDDAYIHPPAPLPQAPLVPGPLAAAPLAAPLASPTPQPPAVAVDDAPVPAYTDLPTLGTWANFWAAPSAPSTTPVAAFPTAREHLVFGNFASEPSALLPVEGPMDQAAPAVAADPPAVAAAAPAVAAAAPAVALPLAAPAPAVAAVAVVTSAALPAIAEAPAAEEVSDVPWAIPAGRASSPSPVEPPTLQEGQSSVEAPSNIGANVSGTAGGYPPGPAGSSEAHLSDGAVATAAAFSAPPRLQIRPQVADKEWDAINILSAIKGTTNGVAELWQDLQSSPHAEALHLCKKALGDSAPVEGFVRKFLRVVEADSRTVDAVRSVSPKLSNKQKQKLRRSKPSQEP